MYQKRSEAKSDISQLRFPRLRIFELDRYNKTIYNGLIFFGYQTIIVFDFINLPSARISAAKCRA